MKEGHIFIEGFIDRDYQQYINAKLALMQDVDKIILHIQSPGGSVYGGYKAYQALKYSGKQIEAIIEGECQSIATLIMLAASKIVARNPSVIMIHNPYQEMEGDADQLESGASELRAIEQDMISLYAERTKLPPDQIKDMMKKQTSMNATQAKQFGFIDDVTETLKAVAVGKPVITMENKEKQNLMDKFSAMMANVRREIFGPKNMEMTTDKGVVTVDSEDGEFVGKPALIAGAPAPDGDYKLEDGRIMTCAGGIVTAIKEAPAAAQPPQETPEQARIKALEAELANLKATATAAEAAKAEAEQAKVAAEAKNEKVAQMYASLETEFKELRKKTVGDATPPVDAPVNQKRTAAPVSDDAAKAMQDEIFEIAGIKNLFKQN